MPDVRNLIGKTELGNDKRNGSSLWFRIIRHPGCNHRIGTFDSLAAFVSFRHGYHAALFTHLLTAFVLVHRERDAGQ
jgi:hypothetical protein